MTQMNTDEEKPAKQALSVSMTPAARAGRSAGAHLRKSVSSVDRLSVDHT
jgi:hypothetical protein